MLVIEEGVVASPRYSAPGTQRTVTPQVLCLCFARMGNACQCGGRRVRHTALYGNIQLTPPSVPLYRMQLRGGNFCVVDGAWLSHIYNAPGMHCAVTPQVLYLCLARVRWWKSDGQLEDAALHTWWIMDTSGSRRF